MTTEGEHIGTRICTLREKKGMSAAQLARELDVSRASVSEWEHGRSQPKSERLALLADLLGTTVLYLLEGDTSTPRSDGPWFGESSKTLELPHVLRTGAPSTSGKHLPKKVDESGSNITEWPVGKLPLISWVQAGDWSGIVDNFQPGDAEDWIACPFSSGRHGFVLRVVGDSMYNPGGELSFRDGDFISVNPEYDARHRSLVIARRDREKATFKQLLLDETDGPMLHALNPNWPTRYIPFGKTTEIVGVVTGQWRPLV